MMTQPSTSLNKPIALIGMMGTGKTTFGTMLCEKLAAPFIDTDAQIIKRAGKSIPEIFESEGEAAFRALEKQAIKDALETAPPAIIATGGGAVTAPETLALLKYKTHLVWLQSTPAEIYARIKRDPNRPLLQTQDPLQTLTQLLEDRTPLYAQAHAHIPVNENDLDQTLAAIINSLL